MTYGIENIHVMALRWAYNCGGVKMVYGIPNLPLMIYNSNTDIAQIHLNSKRRHLQK